MIVQFLGHCFRSSHQKYSHPIDIYSMKRTIDCVHTLTIKVQKIHCGSIYSSWQMWKTGTAVDFSFTADQSHCLMKLTKQSLVSVPRNHLIWWASWWHLLHIACKTDKVFGCSSYIDNSLKYMIIFFNTFIYCISFGYVFIYNVNNIINS